MRIATYNVNGVNGRLPVLLRWLAETQPDVVCLQELKAPDDRFPADAIAQAGYHAIWHGQKSWNGVAILSRIGMPVETRRGLPGDPDPTQSRYLEAAVSGVLVGALYLPNGNPRPGTKFDYKLAWFDALIAHAAELYASGAPVVLAGDFNVMPTARDVYKPERWTQDALFAPEVRERYARLLEQGWTDAVRTLHRTRRSIRSSIISARRSRATPGCGSTISCSAPRLPLGYAAPTSTARRVAGTRPATMRRCGSNSPSRTASARPRNLARPLLRARSRGTRGR